MLTFGNEWGYRLNVNHPVVNSLYNEYRVKRNQPHGFPFSDSERLDFEDKAIPYLIRNGFLKYEI